MPLNKYTEPPTFRPYATQIKQNKNSAWWRAVYPTLTLLSGFQREATDEFSIPNKFRSFVLLLNNTSMDIV
jgi:hypothetical protein